MLACNHQQLPPLPFSLGAVLITFHHLCSLVLQGHVIHGAFVEMVQMMLGAIMMAVHPESEQHSAQIKLNRV